jgi:hypothetical protein
MSIAQSLMFPRFSIASHAAQSAFGTANAILVPPYPGATSPPLLYQANPKFDANWTGRGGNAWTHIDRIIYTCSTTAHDIYVMRPLNWTTLAAAAAAGQAVISLTDDPGLYSVNYKFPTPGGKVAGKQGGTPPCQVADHGIAANDYVAYQVPDGTWFLDTVASAATLATVTLTTNIEANGTITTALPKGTVLFYFGVFSLSDPATGQPQWNTLSTASTNRINLLGDDYSGGVQSLHPGDPLMLYDANATATGSIELVSGFFARH